MTSTLRSSDGRVIVPGRLRRRRVEVRRNQGRRRLRRVIAFAVLVALIAGGWALLRSPLLAVGDLTVSGSDHVDRDAVERAAGIAPGVPMMDVAPARAEKKLEALPWIASAKVSREWPNRVDVSLIDRVPVAQAPAGRAFVFLDAEGRVLESGVARQAGLPLLDGPRATEPGSRVADAEPLLLTASSLPDAYRDDVSTIGLANDGSVALTMREGGTVTLGRSEAFDAKFASLSTVLDHLGDLGAGCTLDVSVPTAPTLTPEYGCA